MSEYWQNLPAGPLSFKADEAVSGEYLLRPRLEDALSDSDSADEGEVRTGLKTIALRPCFRSSHRPAKLLDDRSRLRDHFRLFTQTEARSKNRAAAACL